MGATVSAGADNDELVDKLLEADYIKTAVVERVFRAVDRGHYFTVECKHNAYKDLAWKCGNLHISAPSIYSEVMENLKLAPGMSFLNLGSGTGYLSTMAGLILGSYGINHGIEIHEDVTDYAKKKLEEFCSTSPALDEYEFCRPKFINGNCLNLGSEARQYDRVYCGVACPENHENYMKNLIKVGGILVMPINNQLLQIYRISDTNWETKSVLPVSFASLISSNVSNPDDTLKMPDADPLSLQDICRFAVRSILRRKIDMEHPELQKKPSGIQMKKMKKKGLQKFVMSVFGSQSDSENSEIDEEDNTDVHDYGKRAFLMDANSVRSCGALLELGHHIPGPSRGEATQEAEERDASQEEMPDEECEIDFEMGDVDKLFADSSCQQNVKVKREKFDSGIVEDMENRRDTSSESENEFDWEPWESNNLFFKFEDSDTETGDSDAVIDEERNGKKSDDGKNYSTYMKEKIKLLPLPMTLKYFVNLNREL